MKTRTDLLNYLAEKYKLERYLEIGVQVPEINFDKIKCKHKISVDPDPNARATICKTSDELFQWLNSGGNIVFSDDPIPETVGGEFVEIPETKFDLIFIDGLHTAEQVKKDFQNALKVLSPRGFIVLHDCNPEKEEHTIVPRPYERGHWNGNVYKFACQLAINDMSYRTVDIDNGCGVYFNSTPIIEYGDAPTWERFEPRRKELLNLISWDEFIKL